MKPRYRRQSIRLPWWDYSQSGWYFVTVCTKDRRCVLGDIVDSQINLSQAGVIVEEEWRRTAIVRQHVLLDEFVLMPNHLHGILVITEGHGKTSHRDVSTGRGLSRYVRVSIIENYFFSPVGGLEPA